LLAAILILIGGVAAYLWWREVQQKRDANEQARQHNAAMLARETAEAQACIDGIARRDPRVDAAADVRRGDATPIGISYMPHTGDWTIFYEGVDACIRRPPYRPTGKWFRHTSFGHPVLPPPNLRRCEAAARNYALAYNAEMLRLAPGAVARFCRQEAARAR
jgi:hypothetical protein